jgi:hypothetical protein
MATITVNQYNDDGTTSRSAGEALTINGATFTQRTDTRWHAGTVANSYSDILPSSTLGGDFVIDATKVRWMPITGGSGTKAIGSTIGQGSVSAYFLGAYSATNAAPSSAIPSTGFIKFREVSGGTFSAGELTNITASATGPDVTGWLEVVMDVAAGTDINIARLNEFRTSGDWFYLDNTNGLVGQQIQVPTNGGGAGTHCPGVWVETGVNTSAFEYYPAFAGAGTGWAYQNISNPGLSGVGQDGRQKFVNTIGNGLMQFGENVSSAMTYTTTNLTATYTWAANVITVTSNAHGLRVGEQVYLDFSTGAASASDGVYTLTANAANTFNVDKTGSGTGGAATVRARSTVTTTGGANNLAIGNLVYVNFTDGGLSAAAGTFMIEAVPTASAFTINSYAAVSAGGNGFLQQTIGYVPVSGCRTRVPNIFLRQCATGSRTVNATPTTTLANRPEFITTAAGNIKMEYCYGDWYLNFSQPFYIHIKNCATFEGVVISECASPLDIDGLGVSQVVVATTAIPALTLTSNFAGGTISNGCFERIVAANNAHAISITYCNNITFNNIRAGIIAYARGTGYSFNMATCNGLTFNNCKSLNSTTISLATSQNTIFTNLDWCDRYMGYTNATTNSYCCTVAAGCVNTKIDGVTFGLGGTVINNHPYVGILSLVGALGVKLRNCGTRSSMLTGGTIPLYSMATAVVFGTNNNDVKLQRIYFQTLTTRAALFTEANSEINVIRESLHNYQYKTTAGVITDNTLTPVTLNSSYKGIGYSLNTTTGQTSIYGTHWSDIFVSDNLGRIFVAMNEPTSTTIANNTLTKVGSTGGFTSTGSLSLQTSGDSYITITDYYFKGHVALTNTVPVINGTNVTYVSGARWGAHEIKYQIDTSGVWNGIWKDFNATNLSAEPISTTGFKLQYKIDCVSANATNLVTFIRIETSSTSAAQVANLYDLDTNTVTLNGLTSGSEVRAYYGTDPATAIEVAGIESSTSAFTFSHSKVGAGYIKIFALNKQPIELPWTYSAEDKEIPVQPVIDRVFSNL